MTPITIPENEGNYQKIYNTFQPQLDENGQPIQNPKGFPFQESTENEDLQYFTE